MQGTMALDAIEFHRTGSQVVYRFLPDGTQNGKPRWRRLDLDLWCIWLDHVGWTIIDRDGTQLSWPAERTLALGERPPMGLWISQKGERSYTYNLLYVGDSEPYQGNSEHP